MPYATERQLLNSKALEYYKKEEIRMRLEEPTEVGERMRHTRALLLDSSLISQTKLEKFDIKVIECGEYKSVYVYDNSKYRSSSGKEKIDETKERRKNDTQKVIRKMFSDTELTKDISKEQSRGDKLLKIELKNINRSKIEMQRLVKCNIHDFKTFITLTFDENRTDADITNVADCNKKLNIWLTYIKRLCKNQKKELKYICVPEFQKRGAVHYHLLTNIDYTDFSLLCQEERKIWNKSSRQWQIGRDVKGWKYGHNMAKNMDGINVVGYLSKYMTKDIDNRLFGKHRYTYSYNLKRPTEYYVDTSNPKDVLYYLKSLNNTEVVYENKYYDKYENEVLFVEYKKNNSIG